MPSVTVFALGITTPVIVPATDDIFPGDNFQEYVGKYVATLEFPYMPVNCEPLPMK